MSTAASRSLLRAALIGLALAFPPPPSWAQAEIIMDPAESCVTSSCHDDMGQQEFVHAVAADGDQCDSCHEMREEGRHGFDLVAEDGELCALCHGDMAEQEVAHLPVAEGLCTFCHDPHQSDNPKQLNFPPTSELCFNCHDEDEFANETTHGPVGKGQCLACHNPHASDHDRLLKAEVPELCFSCHDRKLKDAKGAELPSSTQLLEDAEMKLHPPFLEGLCAACHVPHASENYRLLVSSYPKSLYASFSPARYMCFNCHSEAAFTESRTLTETGFRNGNLNLHFRHVNKEKGRACKACHRHHGAANEKLIRDRVPFGKHFISIAKFELTPTGGTCAPTCHRQVSYDRYEPVLSDMKVTPREGIPATREELDQARKEQLGE